MNVTGSTPGQPYSEAAIASDRNNILAMYYNEGFPEARFHEEMTCPPSGAQSHAASSTTSPRAQRIEVSKVLLTGYQFTRPGIIRAGGRHQARGSLARRRHRGHPAPALQSGRVQPRADRSAKSQRRRPAESGGRGRRGGPALHHRLRRSDSKYRPWPEAAPILTAPPSAPARAEFSKLRARICSARAQTLSFRARASTLQYRAALSYTADNLLTKNSLSLQLTGFADKTQDVNTFTSTRFEGSVQLVEKVSPSSSLLYRYFYRRVEVSQIANTIQRGRDPAAQPADAWSPALASPTRATAATIPATPSTATSTPSTPASPRPLWASSADFFRGSFQNSTFTSFGRDFVFARSLRFGVEQPYGNTASGIPTTCIPRLPPTRRDHSAAGAILRRRRHIAPRLRPEPGRARAIPAPDFPLADWRLLEFNQELHFPTRFSIAGSRLGGAIFYDGGNVFRDINHITFAWKPPSITDLTISRIPWASACAIPRRSAR